MTPREHSLSQIGLIALRHGVTRHDILGKSKRQKETRARQHCYYHFHLEGRTWKQIARLMNRDHSTVIHGAKTHRDRLFRLHENAGNTAGLI